MGLGLAPVTVTVRVTAGQIYDRYTRVCLRARHRLGHRPHAALLLLDALVRVRARARVRLRLRLRVGVGVRVRVQVRVRVRVR